MMGKRDERARGQNTLEMVFLVVAIAVTVLGLQVQVKRAMAGRVRTSLDQLSQQHFDPNVPYNFTTSISGGGGTTTTTQTNDGGTTTEDLNGATATTKQSYHLGDATPVPVP